MSLANGRFFQLRSCHLLGLLCGLEVYMPYALAQARGVACESGQGQGGREGPGREVISVHSVVSPKMQVLRGGFRVGQGFD